MLFSMGLYQFVFSLTVYKDSLSPHLCKHLLFVVILWCPFRQAWGDISLWFLICISLMVGGIQHLFRCPLAVYISSLEKYLFRFSVRYCFFAVLLAHSFYCLVSPQDFFPLYCWLSLCISNAPSQGIFSQVSHYP